MRVLALVVGMTAVTGAWAGEYDIALQESDAVTAQFVFETRFGGEAGAPAARSFRLQIANEGQRLRGLAPLRAEYVVNSGRQDTGRFLVNGMDVEQLLISRQEEEGGIASLWEGWLPLAIVIGAASLIIVDGQNQTVSGSGGSGV